ncbi:hypothetical protein VN97_g2358 [Penicillium thymicola]|uniref:Uncharacterized protein n=1 Tax=Penicillium thymicola TaxID=293382 RepID=A0AAI9TQL9_PENTH|nr:hypothetical protein VN97_g2358 [Penicillium thymicola]
MFVSPAFVEEKKKEKVAPYQKSTTQPRLIDYLPRGALETRLAYSAPPRHSKSGGQRDRFFLSKEVSLITLTDAFIGPLIFFSFFQTRQNLRPSRSPALNDHRLSAVPVSCMEMI